MKKFFPPLIPMILFLGVIEFLVRNEKISSFLIPTPSSVFYSLKNDWRIYLEALTSTLKSASLGLLISVIFGFLFSLFLGLSKSLKAMFYPYTTFFQTVPIVSIAPVLVIWFGYGSPTVIASAFICSVFPIIANTIDGLESTDPSLLDLFKLYRSGSIQTLLKCKIPSALPQFFTGLRISSGLAVIGAIVGEFIGGGGIGSHIEASRAQQRMDQIFASVIISAFLGLSMLLVVNILSWFTLRRRFKTY